MRDFLSPCEAAEVSAVLAGGSAGAGFGLNDENFGTATLLFSLPDMAEAREAWVVMGVWGGVRLAYLRLARDGYMIGGAFRVWL